MGNERFKNVLMKVFNPEDKIARKKDEMVFFHLLDTVVKDWKSVGVIHTEPQELWLKCKLSELVSELCNEKIEEVE